MSSDGNESLSTANTDNYLVPVTIDKEPIIFNGNKSDAYKTQTHFLASIQHRQIDVTNAGARVPQNLRARFQIPAFRPRRM